MSQPEKVFDFLTERRLGVAGQNLALAALCCDTDWRVVGATSDTREQERLHVDQLAEFQGSRVLIEIKTDMRGLQTQRLAPISRALGYAQDVEDGKAEPTGPIDYGRGLVTGQR